MKDSKGNLKAIEIHYLAENFPYDPDLLRKIQKKVIDAEYIEEDLRIIADPEMDMSFIEEMLIPTNKTLEDIANGDGKSQGDWVARAMARELLSVRKYISAFDYENQYENFKKGVITIP